MQQSHQFIRKLMETSLNKCNKKLHQTAWNLKPALETLTFPLSTLRKKSVGTYNVEKACLSLVICFPTLLTSPYFNPVFDFMEVFSIIFVYTEHFTVNNNQTPAHSVPPARSFRVA